MMTNFFQYYRCRSQVKLFLFRNMFISFQILSYVFCHKHYCNSPVKMLDSKSFIYTRNPLNLSHNFCSILIVGSTGISLLFQFLGQLQYINLTDFVTKITSVSSFLRSVETAEVLFCEIPYFSTDHRIVLLTTRDSHPPNPRRPHTRTGRSD